jgi:hypothetical protein
MLFTPAGATGLAASLVAPREAFLHQVLTTYQEGLYNVLYSSIPEEDIKPAWRQAAAARTQRVRRAGRCMWCGGACGAGSCGGGVCAREEGGLARQG